MNGQTKLSKIEIIDGFIKNTKPYDKPLPIKFDLRAYNAFITEHKLNISDITFEIMQKFNIELNTLSLPTRHCETAIFMSLRAYEVCVVTWQSRKPNKYFLLLRSSIR